MNDVAKEVTGPLTGRTLTVGKGGKVTPKADAKKSGEVVNFPQAEAKDGAKKAPAKAKAKVTPKAEAKAAPAKAKKSKRGYPSEAKIKLVSKDNPHREKSGDFKKWKALTDLSAPKTVEKALEAGADTGYLRLLVKRELIEVEA